MGPDRKRTCMKYSTVIGSIIVLLPNGLFWYWGNMSVYNLSYIVTVLQSTSGVESPWIISTFLASWILSVTLSSLLANRVGRRCTILIGALVSDVGIFLSYFAVQNSLIGLTFSMGVSVGLGTGLIDGSALQLVIEWADNDVGTLSALLQGAFAFGALIINHCTTLYLNPDNLSPDMKVGPNIYFTQKVILDKVPSSYYVLGCFAVGSHVVGMSLLKPKPQEDILGKSDPSIRMDYLSLQEIANESPKGSSGNRTRLPSLDINERRDYSPKEMMRSYSFIPIWIAFFLGDIPLLVLTNYYKSFGQIWIHDDHFLTNLGTAIIFINTWVNILWGVAMDKFGVKRCLTGFTAAVVVLQCWYYLTPIVNRWLYFVVTLGYGSIVGAIFSCYTAGVALLYGKTHFSTNFGIVMSSDLVFNLMAPPLLHIFLTHFGYFSLFAMSAGLNIIGLILILIFVPSINM